MLSGAELLQFHVEAASPARAIPGNSGRILLTLICDAVENVLTFRGRKHRRDVRSNCLKVGIRIRLTINTK